MPTISSETIRECKRLIAFAKTEDVFKILSEHSIESNEIITLSSRWQALKNQNISGTLSNESLSEERNKINYSLLLGIEEFATETINVTTARRESLNKLLKTVSYLVLLTIIIGSFFLGSELGKEKYLYQSNLRNVKLGDIIKQSGLSDIENRTDTKNKLPPEKLYTNAKNEIAISCISCNSTIDQYNEILKFMMKKGVSVKLLLLNPLSPDLSILSQKEKKDMKMEILQSIRMIKDDSLFVKKNFHVKFIDEIPTFLGVMIDGDIEVAGEIPNDSKGLIRVQPYLKNTSGHIGWIFQFNRDTLNKTAFDDFATEFRQRWKKDASYHNEFFK